MMSQIRVTNVVGQPVTKPTGDALGRVSDLVVRLVDGATPTVTGALLRLQGGDVFVSMRDVAALDDAGVRLSSDTVDTRPFERRPGEVLLERDVRGRAVIDVERGRLVRVSDLELEQQGGRWHVVAVIASPPAGLSSLVNRIFGRVEAPEEIEWRHLEPLVGHVPTVGKGIPFPRLAQLKPAEIADLVEQATHHEGEQILEAVSADEELEADVFEELDEEHRVEFLKDRSDEEAAELLAKMEPDAAADLLMELPQERRQPILELLEPDLQSKIRSLLGYNRETAGGLMNNEFVARPGDESAADAVRTLREMDEVPAILTDIYVVEGDRLAGSLTLLQLLRANPEAHLRDVMQSDPEAVFADADLPSIAVHMADYNLAALPVIDEAGRLVGIVTYDDLIDAMLPDEWRWRGGPVAARVGEAGSAPAGPQHSA